MLKTIAKNQNRDQCSAGPSVTSRTTAALARLGQRHWQGACTRTTADRALVQAKRSDARLAQGQELGCLDGAHVVWKDIIDQADEVTTCGSLLRRDAPRAQQNAVVVQRLESAGAVSLARTGLSEFAFSGLGINPQFGTPVSALTTTEPLLPGGSTSGAAVLVAHGLADLGVGTDTSGSIRIPAALNGIFGFRPSSARYDRTGVHELSKTLDTVGTVSRSFGILRAADDVLSTQPVSAENNGKVEILDLSGSFGPSWSQEVAQAYDEALAHASAAGWAIRATRLQCVDDLDALLKAEGPLVAIEARRKYADLLASTEGGQIDPMIRARLSGAPVLSDWQLAQYLQRRAQLVDKARLEIGNRLITFPTVPSLRHALSTYQTDPKAAQTLNAQLLAATMVGSLLDWPGLAVPLRREDGRVQGSMLLSATSGNDGLLLSQAEQIIPKITHSSHKIRKVI